MSSAPSLNFVPFPSSEIFMVRLVIYADFILSSLLRQNTSVLLSDNYGMCYWFLPECEKLWLVHSEWLLTLVPLPIFPIVPKEGIPICL